MKGSALDHARRMDRLYGPQRHIYDLTRRLFLPGRDHLLRGIRVADGGTILEVGCGTGRNLQTLAGLLPTTRLFGIDVSREMLRTAAASFGRPGSGRVELARCAAADLNCQELFGLQERFDAIFFSYSLSMMLDWRESLRATFANLVPGGSLHLVDFGDLRGWPHGACRLARWWLERWQVRPIPELLPVLQAEATERGMVVTVRTIAGGYALVARMKPEVG